MKPSRTTPAGKGRAGIIIGRRYTGKYAGHVDTTSGNYWEALPQIVGDALALQQCLLAKPRPPRKSLRDRFNARVDAALDPLTGVMRGAA